MHGRKMAAPSSCNAIQDQGFEKALMLDRETSLWEQPRESRQNYSTQFTHERIYSPIAMKRYTPGKSPQPKCERSQRQRHEGLQGAAIC